MTQGKNLKDVSIDRPLKDIVASIMHYTGNSPKMSLQMRRDLEKLCAAASAHPTYEKGE